MMICPECGHRNEQETTFCASCQVFLDWDASRAETRPAPAATAPASSAPAPAPAAPPDGPAGAGGANGADGPVTPTGTPPGGTPPAAPARRPEEPIPTAAPRRPDHPLHGESGDGPDHRPEPLHPDAPGGEPPPEAPHRTPRPCLRCGTDNPADRRLCTRCGTLLDPARAVRPTTPMPWWRRILPGREHRPLAAGSRPRLRRLPRPRLTLPVLLLVLAAVAWFGRAHLSEVFTFTQDRTGSGKPLHPTVMRASSQAPGHPAKAAFDSYSNRSWMPAVHGPGTGQYLEADFDRPVRLQTLLLTTGTSAKQNEFLTEARPSEITVTLTSSEGRTTVRTLDLADAPRQRGFTVRGSDVTRVRLTVNAAYGARKDRRVAVAEVEFFGRQ